MEQWSIPIQVATFRTSLKKIYAVSPSVFLTDFLTTATVPRPYVPASGSCAAHEPTSPRRRTSPTPCRTVQSCVSGRSRECQK
jgi:hypothetical protein